ncbi:MAG TPA: ABC transporter permease [Bdellovibrionota bacterium]|nr:ABC transporter permease [Bdellovibrionota bacterium]
MFDPGFDSSLCFKTLVKKEIKRFFSVSVQTLLAPLVSALLYLLVFGVSLGGRISLYENLSYLQFVVPGLVIMGIINNSFANVSSSLFLSRYMGSIVDLLVTPLTPLQFIMGYSVAAMIRGLLVGGLVLGVGLCFTELPWANPGMALLIAVLSSFLFAQFGFLAAIWSKSFDTLTMFTNFLILPLIYLGGLFYPVENLPAPWAQLSLVNPLAYLISSFRASLLGVGQLGYGVSLTITLVFCAAFFAANWFIVRSGYRLRS